MRVAITLLHPWAMFANGPPCTKAGVWARVCTRLGLSASLRRAHTAPVAFRSPAVTILSSYVLATIRRETRLFRSAMFMERHSVAMISLAVVMSNPSSRGFPLLLPPRPVTMKRSCLSFMSMQRRQVMRLGSMSRGFPCWMELSSIAAIRLFAAVIACRSPVKWRLMSSMGTTCDQPPPAAPPLRPNTGPRDGSLSARATLTPFNARASARPIETVVLPSPAGVGFIAVTRTRRPFLLRDSSAA